MWWEIPKHLEVRNDTLFIAGKSTIELAQEYGTPLYVINADRIRANYQRLYSAVTKHLSKDRNFDINYAMKAHSGLAVLETLKEVGSHVDATSSFEVLTAEYVGFPKEKILYTGTSVKPEDMRITLGKAKMNIDSIGQIDRYAKLKDEEKFNPRVSIRINPGKGAGHVPECITAGKDAKYGVPEYQTIKAYKMAIDHGLEPVGIHCHIGSGILPPDIGTYYSAAETLLDLAGEVSKKLNIEFEFVDIGGGIGIPYKETDKPINMDIFGKKVAEIVESKADEHSLDNFTLKMEPGRYIVGNSEILLMAVVDVSDKYMLELGVDGGFNVFDRPARYNAYHEIVIANKADEEPKKDYRVSGNLCESGDVFTESKKTLRKLPFAEENDLIAILHVGAYGLSMASNYNMRGIPMEIMVDGGEQRITRERDTWEDLVFKQNF